MRRERLERIRRFPLAHIDARRGRERSLRRLVIRAAFR
jgi:hypothetical protein